MNYIFAILMIFAVIMVWVYAMFIPLDHSDRRQYVDLYRGSAGEVQIPRT